MNSYEWDSAVSSCLEIDGRNDSKDGNKERYVLDSLGEANLADKTNRSIGSTEHSLDPVPDMIFPWTSERKEDKAYVKYCNFAVLWFGFP